ncbi:GLE1-like protein [Catenaria anguillulae PL171]|uniref:mRNA export factor GLE1 n=1 Tax=Catenaria anguillulae PL171 TaxID=765915 RepID=A0A1Y2I197_9FUNG|nr:GLE1-like protein [Catenaria anguillulae PL171]
MSIIQRMKTEINPLMKTPENKRAAIDMRKTINTAVGQLNNTREKLNQVFMKVEKYLRDLQTQSPDLHYPYALNLLAKSFCRQAEAEMRPDVTKAFPYGQVAVLIMCRHPEFRRYLLARMFKFCPYLIPRWYVPKNDQERKSLLRRRQGEDDEKYMERMSTHVALFAAMLQTTPIIPAFKNPLPIGLAWKWFAYVLNHPPQPLMVFLIEKFLLIAGHAFLEAYGKQGQKIMHILVHEYSVKCGDSVRPVRSRWEGMWNPVQQRWVIDVSSERDPKVAV